MWVSSRLLLDPTTTGGRATASESAEKQCEWQASPPSALLVPKRPSSGTSNVAESLQQGRPAQLVHADDLPLIDRPKENRLSGESLLINAVK